jgi:hypothetical protein
VATPRGLNPPHVPACDDARDALSMGAEPEGFLWRSGQTAAADDASRRPDRGAWSRVNSAAAGSHVPPHRYPWTRRPAGRPLLAIGWSGTPRRPCPSISSVITYARWCAAHGEPVLEEAKVLAWLTQHGATVRTGTHSGVRSVEGVRGVDRGLPAGLQARRSHPHLCPEYPSPLSESDLLSRTLSSPIRHIRRSSPRI